MPNMPSLAIPVLTKTQRQQVREQAYKLLEKGYAPLVVHDYLAMLFSTNAAVIREALRNMEKPATKPAEPPAVQID